MTPSMAVVLGLLAIAAPVNWVGRVRAGARFDLVTKPIVTLLVIALAIVHPGEGAAGVLTLVALGFCLVGDIALLGVVDRFVVGLASFLVAHVLFTASFVADGITTPWLAVPVVVVAGPALVIVGRRVVPGSRAVDPRFGGPVLAYLGVISAMTIVAAMTGNPWAIVGALVFCLSDAVLGWGRFVRSARYTAVVVMVTYHSAITMLAVAP
jgi:alkenylglycerophosphocholine hydrolase